MQPVFYFVICCCYAADGFLLLLPDTADSLSCIVQKFNYNLYGIFFFCVLHFSKKRRKLFIDIARECTTPHRPPAQCQVSCYPGLIHVCQHITKGEKVRKTGTELKLLANWLLTLPGPTLSCFYCLIVDVTLSASGTSLWYSLNGRMSLLMWKQSSILQRELLNKKAKYFKDLTKDSIIHKLNQTWGKTLKSISNFWIKSLFRLKLQVNSSLYWFQETQMHFIKNPILVNKVKYFFYFLLTSNILK